MRHVQERGGRKGFMVSHGLALAGPLATCSALPRSRGQGGHCPKDDLAVTTCTRAGVSSRRSSACASITHGPGHLASRSELLFFPREPARGGRGAEERSLKIIPI